MHNNFDVLLSKKKVSFVVLVPKAYQIKKKKVFMKDEKPKTGKNKTLIRFFILIS